MYNRENCKKKYAKYVEKLKHKSQKKRPKDEWNIANKS